MEEFGFFDTVEEHLPEDFTLIYEIARIIEDATNSLSQQLAPILELEHSGTDNTSETILVPFVPDAKEYEADLIKSVTEVRHIYPHQFLLPETVFLQRLAERSLWMPRARTPRNFRYQLESDRFAPDDRKQKVYVLFDTSSSMQHHYRIHLAKAIAYLFLRRNQKELGTVFFRTFDVALGDLRTARDPVGFEHLISDIMHIKALGNGTVLQKALQQAIEDIQHESQLSQAQILVITDGVAHIDLEGLRSQMGDSVVVHTVKIGTARMQVDDKLIEDLVFKSSSDDARRLRELILQQRDIDASLRAAAGQKRIESLNNQAAFVQRQIDTLKQRFAAQVDHEYGSEMAALSTVFLEIQDIDPRTAFNFSEDKVRELEELAASLLEELRSEHQVEDMKRAAVLYDHLYLLMQYNAVDAPRLERYARELEELLNQILNRPGTTADDLSISDEQRLQLRNMIGGGLGADSFSLARLLRMLGLKIRRWLSSRRQLRLFRRLSGKKIQRRRQ